MGKKEYCGSICCNCNLPGRHRHHFAASCSRASKCPASASASLPAVLSDVCSLPTQMLSCRCVGVWVWVLGTDNGKTPSKVIQPNCILCAKSDGTKP